MFQPNVDEEEEDIQELEDFRRTYGRGITAEEKEMELRKVRAVPCIKWVRQTRENSTAAFGDDKIVYIYGEENIRQFFAWRQSKRHKATQVFIKYL